MLLFVSEMNEQLSVFLIDDVMKLTFFYQYHSLITYSKIWHYLSDKSLKCVSYAGSSFSNWSSVTNFSIHHKNANYSRKIIFNIFWWEDQAFKHEAIERCCYSMVVQHRRRLLVLMCRSASAHSSYTSNEYMYVFVLLTTYILSSTWEFTQPTLQ